LRSRDIASSRSEGLAHIFQRSSQDSSRRSNHTNLNDSSDDHVSHRPASRSSYARSDSKPPSRPTSRASRKRSESVSTTGDKEKEREKPRRKSVTGWASSAVESVTGLGKKNKDKFAALPDNDHTGDGGVDDPAEPNFSLNQSESFSIGTKRSKENSTNPSPKPPARILNPPSLQEKKVARAHYSFSGASDELSFEAGDEIVVINEVLEGWWMGELNGKRGLFPTTHVDVLVPGSRRAPKLGGSGLDVGGDANWTVADESETDSNLASDMDERDLRSEPLVNAHQRDNGLHLDTMSITGSITEDDESKRLMPVRYGSDDYAVDEHYFQIPSSRTPPGLADRKILSSLNSSPRPIRLPDIEPPLGKKAPPPPPPRRPTVTPTATPPIPERPYRPYRHTPSPSVNSLKVAPSVASSLSGYDRSPFESVTELSAP
jgi:SH3 domain